VVAQVTNELEQRVIHSGLGLQQAAFGFFNQAV
jgi:hypothetical protein